MAYGVEHLWIQPLAVSNSNNTNISSDGDDYDDKNRYTSMGMLSISRDLMLRRYETGVNPNSTSLLRVTSVGSGSQVNGGIGDEMDAKDDTNANVNSKKRKRKILRAEECIPWIEENIIGAYYDENDSMVFIGFVGKARIEEYGIDYQYAKSDMIQSQSGNKNLQIPICTKYGRNIIAINGKTRQIDYAFSYAYRACLIKLFNKDYFNHNKTKSKNKESKSINSMNEAIIKNGSAQSQRDSLKTKNINDNKVQKKSETSESKQIEGVSDSQINNDNISMNSASTGSNGNNGNFEKKKKNNRKKNSKKKQDSVNDILKEFGVCMYAVISRNRLYYVAPKYTMIVSLEMYKHFKIWYDRNYLQYDKKLRTNKQVVKMWHDWIKESKFDDNANMIEFDSNTIVFPGLASCNIVKSIYDYTRRALFVVEKVAISANNNHVLRTYFG